LTQRRPRPERTGGGREDVKVLFLRDNTGNLVELAEPVEPTD